MKAFMNLVLNEIIKIWKQTGYRVVVFIMIGLALLSPLVGLIFTADFFAFTAEDEYESYKEWAEESKGIEYEYFNAYAEAYKFFIDNDITDGWQYKNYSYEYSELYVEERAYELVVEGKYSAEEVVGFFGVLLEDKNEAEALYNETKTLRRNLEKQILMSESQFIPATIEMKTAEISELETNLDILEKAYSATPNEYNESTVVLARLQLNIAKTELECLETMNDRDAGPDSWEYRLMQEEMSHHAYNMMASLPMLEDEYESMSSWALSLSYDDYVKDCKGNVDYYRKEFNKCVYAIENNINIHDANVNSQTATAMESAISNFGIVMMVIVATMIAGEYSKGTIRLLLIRPRSRTQIIASKLVAASVILLGLTVASLFLVSIENLLIYGAGSFFDVISIGDTPTKIPAFLVTLGAVGVAMLTVFADMALTALLSSLTKKTGTAIVLPMLFKFMISSIIMGIGIALMELLPRAFGWLVYSPIPYISMTLSGISGGALMGFTGFWKLNIWLGVAYHVVFVAILVWLTIVRFNKTQIKG